MTDGYGTVNIRRSIVAFPKRSQLLLIELLILILVIRVTSKIIPSFSMRKGLGKIPDKTIALCPRGMAPT
jgi:hypothetical protein